MSFLYSYQSTYDQLGTDGVFLVSLGGFDNIAPLGDILGVLLVGLPHLRSARHLDCGCPGVAGDTSVGRLSLVRLVAGLGWILLELPTQHKMRADRAQLSQHLPVTCKSIINHQTYFIIIKDYY